MKKLFVCLSIWSSATVYAGGTIGGSTGFQASLSLADIAFGTKDLQKVYIDPEIYQNTQKTLMQEDSVLLETGGETLVVRKVRRTLVDESFSKEILPHPQ